MTKNYRNQSDVNKWWKPGTLNHLFFTLKNKEAPVTFVHAKEVLQENESVGQPAMYASVSLKKPENDKHQTTLNAFTC